MSGLLMPFLKDRHSHGSKGAPVGASKNRCKVSRKISQGLLQRPWREAKSVDCAVLFVAVRVGKSPDTLGSRRNGPNHNVNMA